MPIFPAAMVQPTIPAMLENNATQLPGPVTRALSRKTVNLDSEKNILLEAAKDLSGKKLSILDNVKIAEDDYFSNYWIAASENSSECKPSLVAYTNAMNGFFKNMEQSHSTQLLMLSEHAQIILERNDLGAIMFSDANLVSGTVLKSEYSAIDEKLTCDVIRALYGEIKYEALMQRINQNAAADAATKKMESVSLSRLQNGVDSCATSTLVVFATSRTSEVSEALITQGPMAVVDEFQPKLLASEIGVPALNSGPVLTLVPTGSTLSKNFFPERSMVHNDYHRSVSIGSYSSLSGLEDSEAEEFTSNEHPLELDDEDCLNFSDILPDAPDRRVTGIVSQQTDDMGTSQVRADVRGERESSEAKELGALIFSTLENGKVDPEWEATDIIDGIIENLTGTARNIEDRTLYTNLKTDKQRLAESTKNNQIKMEEAQKKLRELPEPIRGDISAAALRERTVFSLNNEIAERDIQLQMTAETLKQEKKCSVRLTELFEKNCKAKKIAKQSSLRIEMLKEYNDQRVLFRQASDRQDSIESSSKQRDDNAKPEAASGQGSNNVVLPAAEKKEIASAIDAPKEADKNITTGSHRVSISSTNSAVNKKMVDAVAKYKMFMGYASRAEAELEMKTTEVELKQEMMENMLPILLDNVKDLFEPEGERSTQAINRSSFRRTAMIEPNRTFGTAANMLSQQQLRDTEQGANL